MVFDSGGELPTKRTAGKRFRFGSFNHARKLTQATIDLFCRVMSANPEAELALKSISFLRRCRKKRIRRRFEKAGLSASDLFCWIGLKMVSTIYSVTAKSMWRWIPFPMEVPQPPLKHCGWVYR